MILDKVTRTQGKLNADEYCDGRVWMQFLNRISRLARNPLRCT